VTFIDVGIVDPAAAQRKQNAPISGRANDQATSESVLATACRRWTYNLPRSFPFLFPLLGITGVVMLSVLRM
jgi:hypothetical protein